jgi:hypothetical protein
VPEELEKGNAATIAVSFLGLFEPAEFDQGFAAGRFGRHARPEVVFHMEL